MLFQNNSKCVNLSCNLAMVLSLLILTLYSMIMPFDAFEIYYVFENIMKNGAFAP